MMSSLACGGSLAVNGPRYAEAIYEHAKADGPERLLKRHFHRPVFCQCREDALCLCLILEAEGQTEPLRCLIAIRQSISAIQYVVTHLERGMKDFLTPFVRHWILLR